MALECNAVFKGGGAKGIAYVGALEAMEQWDADFREVAGSSAGAITATLVACGYSAAEIVERMPEALAQIDSVASSMAMFGVRSSLLSNDALHRWLKAAIAEKIAPPGYDVENPPECTFREIEAKQTADGAPGTALYVVTLDLSTRQPLVFCPKLTPDSPVAPAVVASSAIPVAFPPARMKVNGATHRLVDGGTWSNYPSFVFLDKDFRHWAGLPETTRTTIGFILDTPDPEPDGSAGEEVESESASPQDPGPIPDLAAESDPGSASVPERVDSPLPVGGAPLLTDHGSSADELELPGAIISSPLFRAAIALAPILFVLLSLFWVSTEFESDDPLIGRLPLQLQDVAMLMTFFAFAVTGVAATVLAVIVLRFGKSLFDTGVVGATAAMGVGPSVPEWVGRRSVRGTDAEIEEGTHVPDHVAVRINVPEELTTLAFRASKEVQLAACVQGRADTERELERVFGPPTRAASTDLQAIMSLSPTKVESPPQSRLRRLIMWPLRALARVFEAVAKLVGRLLSWTAHKSVPRFVVLAYALIVGTAAAVNVMVGFGDGRTWTTLGWILVVVTGALAAIWLLASMRESEAKSKTQYKYLRRLKNWPIVLVAISAVAFALAATAAWTQLSYNDVSMFTALRAASLPGDVIDVEDDGLYVVAIEVPLADQDDEAFFALLDTVEPYDSDSPRQLEDLVGFDVGYAFDADGLFDDDATAIFVFESVNRVEVGDPATVKLDPDRSLAYIEGDLESDLGVKLQLQVVMIVSLVLLTVAFRSLRAARWARQQKKNDQAATAGPSAG